LREYHLSTVDAQRALLEFVARGSLGLVPMEGYTGYALQSEWFEFFFFISLSLIVVSLGWLSFLSPTLSVESNFLLMGENECSTSAGSDFLSVLRVIERIGI
jgi:hypothetical protein